MPSAPGYSPHAVYLLRQNYLQAIVRAGGLPVVVDYAQDCVGAYLERCSGLVLIGGDHTVDPALFGQENRSKLPLNPVRVQAEQPFFHWAFDKQMPILGICAGMQLISVLLGGTLIQDLPSQRPQSLVHKGTDHDLSVVPQTILWRAIGCPKQAHQVNSSHLQAVDDPGPHLRISARALDGVIEAVEATAHPFCLGVQWHPEFSKENHPDRLLLGAFVQACTHFNGAQGGALAR
jgi:putative glutamine amidotransferase